MFARAMVLIRAELKGVQDLFICNTDNLDDVLILPVQYCLVTEIIESAHSCDLIN